VVAKGLIARSSPGSIVNISSQASVMALDSHSLYCATKGALDQLTRVMTLELGPQKIRVNCVNPTVVLTDMSLHWDTSAEGVIMKQRIPLRRFAEVAEIVNPVLFLLSDAASMITGAMLMVDGGYTIS